MDQLWKLLLINKNDNAAIKALKLIAYATSIFLMLVQIISPILAKDNECINEIRGIVYDSNNNALKGVTIEIVGTQYSTKSDDLGTFIINRLDQLKNSPVQIRLFKEGYIEYTRNLKLDEPCVYIHTILPKN